MALIDGVVSEIINDEDSEKWYAIKQIIINRYIMASYLDINNITEIDNIYEVIRQIKEQIDLDQLEDILRAIDEGLAYELQRKASENMFGLGNPEDMDNMLEKFKNLTSEIGVDKVNDLIKLGTQEEASKYAQNEIKKEKAKKKK
jgi:hypothetical protein